MKISYHGCSRPKRKSTADSTVSYRLNDESNTIEHRNNLTLIDISILDQYQEFYIAIWWYFAHHLVDANKSTAESSHIKKHGERPTRTYQVSVTMD